MSKQDKPKDTYEEISLFERDLYEPVEIFFSDKKECERTGSALSSSISLKIFGGTIYPDVYGIKNANESSFEIFMAEGKRDFSGRNFDICKGQGITLQRFADYVYLFFPKESWRQLDDDERKSILNECKNLKLGLLLIDGKTCENILQPFRNEELLDDEKKIDAKELIVRYFPSFGSEENIQFFKNYSGIAMNIAGESLGLLNMCRDVFRKTMGISSVHTHIYYDKEERYFQLGFKKESAQCDIYLTVNPFGRSLFETNKPLLILEKWFCINCYEKKNKINALLDYVKKCIKSNAKIEIVDTKIGNFSVETATQLSKMLKETQNDAQTIIIQQPIEIVGREIEIIVKEVQRRLKHIDSFLKSRPKKNKSS